MMKPACRDCIRWRQVKPKGVSWRRPSRYGICVAKLLGRSPYWAGVVTNHETLSTADVHGADCDAFKARKLR
jgi:hypothetical protein